MRKQRNTPNQQLKEATNKLITCVEIRQSFLKLYKMTKSESYLIKANSWIDGIEDLKQSIRILNEYGTFENYINIQLFDGQMELKNQVSTVPQ